ncbi:hypothetical protein HanRHA438_Chr13g0624631 [Helianthus annuus]|nr:hypothetical protein HanRHA438_Chr13g0624631 [Helianthus annuus]
MALRVFESDEFCSMMIWCYRVSKIHTCYNANSWCYFDPGKACILARDWF